MKNEISGLKFKTSDTIPHEDDRYYVFAPELDCMTDIKTQGGFVIANYKNGKWIHISKEKDFFYDSIVKSQDISQYVKAWIPFMAILSLLPLDIIQWYTAYLRTDNK